MMVVVSSEYSSDLSADVKKMKKNEQPSQRRIRGVLLSLLPSFLLTPPLPNSSHAESQAQQQNHVEVMSTQRLPSPAEPEAELQGRASLELKSTEEINEDGREESTTPGGEITRRGWTLPPAAAAVIDQSPVSVPTEGQQRAAVKRLLFGAGPAEERAAEIGRIASAGGHRARKSLASLGVIPCLVDMLGCPGSAPVAARALVQLADGSYSNKVAMVEAGVVSKLTRALESQQDDCHHTDDALMALLQTVTSLARTSQLAHHLPPPSTYTTLLPALLRAITATTDTPSRSSTSTSTKHAALSALLNLSSHLPNARPIVSSGFIPPLLRMICSEENDGVDTRQKELLPAALAVLGNLALTPEGTAAVEREEEVVPACLVRVLHSSSDSDGECQDRVLRVLAALARRSRSQRRRMAELGVVKVLVEVSLLSESSVARGRAAEMINWFKGPDCCTWAPSKAPVLERYRSSSCADSGRSSSSSGSCGSNDCDAAADDEDGAAVSTSGKQRATTTTVASHHRDEIRRMVRQSLDRNMESIVRRANGTTAATTSRSSSCLAQFSHQHLYPSLEEDIKDSVGNASSKSLPF